MLAATSCYAATRRPGPHATYLDGITVDTRAVVRYATDPNSGCNLCSKCLYLMTVRKHEDTRENSTILKTVILSIL
eukprot:SAG11_NODE_855_length_6868_cov_3.086128_3_plen_76_part_00